MHLEVMLVRYLILRMFIRVLRNIGKLGDDAILYIY